MFRFLLCPALKGQLRASENLSGAETPRMGVPFKGSSKTCPLNELTYLIQSFEFGLFLIYQNLSQILTDIDLGKRRSKSVRYHCRYLFFHEDLGIHRDDRNLRIVNLMSDSKAFRTQLSLQPIFYHIHNGFFDMYLMFIFKYESYYMMILSKMILYDDLIKVSLLSCARLAVYCKSVCFQFCDAIIRHTKTMLNKTNKTAKRVPQSEIETDENFLIN